MDVALFGEDVMTFPMVAVQPGVGLDYQGRLVGIVGGGDLEQGTARDACGEAT
jgi:hypothetical protein